MSNLKRKREEEGNLELDIQEKCAEAVLTISLPCSSSSTESKGQADPQTNGDHQACSPVKETNPTCSTRNEPAGVASRAATTAGRPETSMTIMICGEEVILKGKVGGRRRKQPIETLKVLAYKGRLAMACKANNMMAALEVYREMQSKGIKQDPSVSYGIGLE